MTTARKATKTATPNPALDAIGITALAKSQKADKHRDLLDAGMHQCDFAITGTIDKRKWSAHVAGVLTIAPDSAPVASSSTPWADLLRYAVCSMSEKERREFLATVSKGTIPAPQCGTEKADAVAAELEPALVAYRATKPTPKRGTVTFTPGAAI